MQNRSYVQLLAIILAAGAFVWLSIEGFNENSTGSVSAKVESQNELTQAIKLSDTAFIKTWISDLEKGESSKVEDISGQILAYQALFNNQMLNNDQKVAFAKLKIEHAVADQDVMVGVQTLLGVIKSDSNNIPALEVLGEMSLKSGQIQKAKERYQKLLILQPLNEDYRNTLKSIEGQLGENSN